MNALEDILAANLALLEHHVIMRLCQLSPDLLFLAWVVVVGAIEGSDWRRGRLYAGYYRLIFLAAACLFVLGLAALALWLFAPAWLSARTLTSALTLPAFGLGWCAVAGRPVLR